MLHKLVLFNVRGTANVYEYQEAEVIQDLLEGEYHRNAVEKYPISSEERNQL